MMSTIRAKVHNGRIELPAPAGLPDESEVLVHITPLQGDKIGLEESEWRDDAEALAQWETWLESIEPIPFAKGDSFDDEFASFNVEAVRRVQP